MSLPNQRHVSIYQGSMCRSSLLSSLHRTNGPALPASWRQRGWGKKSFPYFHRNKSPLAGWQFTGFIWDILVEQWLHSPLLFCTTSFVHFPVIMLWTSAATHPPVPCATQPQERSHAATKALAVQQGGLRTGGSRQAVDIAG